MRKGLELPKTGANAHNGGAARKRRSGRRQRVKDVMDAHNTHLVNAHKRMLLARHADREHAVAHKRGVRGAVVGQPEMQNATPDVADTVSYTHLDVYKRQSYSGVLRNV